MQVCIKAGSFWPYLWRIVLTGPDASGCRKVCVLSQAFCNINFNIAVQVWDFLMELCSVGQQPSAGPESQAPQRLGMASWHHALCDKIQEACREAFSIFGCRCTSSLPLTCWLYAVVVAVAWLGLPAACPLCKKREKQTYYHFYVVIIIIHADTTAHLLWSVAPLHEGFYSCWQVDYLMSFPSPATRN